MPLPPSTSGNTSRPEITRGMSDLNQLLPAARCPQIGRRRGQYYIGCVGENGSHPPVEQLPRPGRVVDRVGEHRIAGRADLGDVPLGKVALIGVDRRAAKSLGDLGPIRAATLRNSIAARECRASAPRLRRRHLRGSSRSAPAGSAAASRSRLAATAAAVGGTLTALGLDLDIGAEIELAARVSASSRVGIRSPAKRASNQLPASNARIAASGSARNCAAPVGRALEAVVVADHERAVAGQPHVELDPGAAERLGDAKSGERVLRRARRRAAMADDGGKVSSRRCALPTRPGLRRTTA